MGICIVFFPGTRSVDTVTECKSTEEGSRIPNLTLLMST